MLNNLSDKVKFNRFESKILVDFHSLSDIFTFCLYFVKFNTLMSLHLSNYSYKITVDSLKILPKFPQNVNVCEKCVLHKKFAYYAGIMLDAFVILLCSKLCWHDWLKPK